MTAPMRARSLVRLLLSAALVFSCCSQAADTFRIATYNLNGYFDVLTDKRQPKSAASKAKIREQLRAVQPDVVALQEMGTTNALLELRDSLQREGLDLPYWEHVGGFDTNVHIIILSRFPFASRRCYTNDSFLLGGRRFRVSRGFAEIEVQVTTDYSFTLFTAHLKSKRPVPQADEADLRLEEAKLLREKIDARLASNPSANVVVLGDFNDSKDSASTKAIIGRGRTKLIDTRPAEGPIHSEDPQPRTVTWTHFYETDDSYSRIDYILLSRAMARHWLTNQTYVLACPGWGLASDHRPVVATFSVTETAR